MDNDIEPWGCEVNFENNWISWQITEIDKGFQADKQGVGIGWKIKQIKFKDKNTNKNVCLTLNQKTHLRIENVLQCGQECAIIFQPVSVCFWC